MPIATQPTKIGNSLNVQKNKLLFKYIMTNKYSVIFYNQ